MFEEMERANFIKSEPSSEWALNSNLGQAKPAEVLNENVSPSFTDADGSQSEVDPTRPARRQKLEPENLGRRYFSDSFGSDIPVRFEHNFVDRFRPVPKPENRIRARKFDQFDSDFDRFVLWNLKKIGPVLELEPLQAWARTWRPISNAQSSPT